MGGRRGGQTRRRSRSIPSAEYDRRVRTVRSAMVANETGALLLASPENICYLTGLDHYGYFATTLLIVPGDGPLRIVARQMERPTLAAQVPHCEHFAYADGQDPAAAAARALGSAVSAPATVGAELSSMYLPVDVWSALQCALPNLAWSGISPLLASQRAIKSPRRDRPRARGGRRLRPGHASRHRCGPAGRH